MIEQDSRYKLIELIEKELKSGASEEQVKEKLISCGLEEDKALSVIKALKESKSNHFKGVAIFFGLGAISSTCIFFILLSVIGKESLISLGWPLLGIFALSWIGFSISTKFSGKNVSILRCALSAMTFVSSVILSGTLFLQTGWLQPETLPSASWRYYIVKFFVDIIYILGPTGMAIVFTIFSIAALLLVWGEWFKFKTNDYSGQ